MIGLDNIIVMMITIAVLSTVGALIVLDYTSNEAYDSAIETGTTQDCFSYGCQNHLINHKLDLIMEELEIEYHGSNN